MAADLAEMRKWLALHQVTAAAMEGTGVYWMPLFEVLEEHLDLTVTNARQVKKVPGRKTDVIDSAWLADLLRHGLLRKSFIPPKPIRALRTLTRYRSKLIQARSADRNRLIRELEAMGIKLASVASDVYGVSGIRMIRAIIEGKSSPDEIAELAAGALRNKKQQLAKAVACTATPQQRFSLGIQLNRLVETEKQIAQVEQQIEDEVRPYRKEIELLTAIPGVDFIVACVVIAELGNTLESFPTDSQLCNWVGLAPGANESAGKRKNTRILPGNRYLKPMLVESAHNAARSRNGGYLKAKFWRFSTRADRKRAAVMVAHKILIAIYHVLKQKVPYQDLGAAYLDQQQKERTLRSLAKRAERLGFQASFTAIEPARAPATSGTSIAETSPTAALPQTAAPSPNTEAKAPPSTVPCVPKVRVTRLDPTKRYVPPAAAPSPRAAPAASRPHKPELETAKPSKKPTTKTKAVKSTSEAGQKASTRKRSRK